MYSASVRMPADAEFADLPRRVPDDQEAPRSTKRPGVPKVKGPQLETGDYLLGLSVRRHMTGYALMSFKELTPLQFGLVNIKKAAEVQQKALEIGAVLRDLRDTAAEKLRKLSTAEDKALYDSDDEDEPPKAEEIPEGKNANWIISVDDSTVDRSLPINARENQYQRSIAMLQGLVVADCKRLFKIAPQIIHPRLSRKLLGVHGLGPPARNEVYSLAKVEVPDFPEVLRKNGSMSLDTLLISDAWASARYAQRMYLVAQRKTDQELVARLRSEAMQNRQLRKMEQAASELYPRKAGKDLEFVLETRIQKYVEEKLAVIIEKELRRASH